MYLSGKPIFYPQYFNPGGYEIKFSVARFFLVQHTKMSEIAPNDHKIYPQAINIQTFFHSKARLNVPRSQSYDF
jgi:hypothetical protein